MSTCYPHTCAGIINDNTVCKMRAITHGSSCGHWEYTSTLETTHTHTYFTNNELTKELKVGWCARSRFSFETSATVFKGRQKPRLTSVTAVGAGGAGAGASPIFWTKLFITSSIMSHFSDTWAQISVLCCSMVFISAWPASSTVCSAVGIYKNILCLQPVHGQQNTSRQQLNSHAT